ncbi:unnamed protein product [Hermetia illucens]|uniref:Uncharacterized protein n=1 Tax=Hermetia illucens TaxID=343691 RepID=A0A7R8UUA8_HERIL|nr:unnamed protein product [Hermetia illucens]
MTEIDKGKVKEFMIEKAKECQTAKVTFDNLAPLIGNSSASDEGKCFFACTLKKLGVFTEKGEFSEKGTNELTEILGKINPDHIKIETTDFAEIVILGCGDIEEKAECDRAFKTMECLTDFYGIIHGKLF